MHREACVRRVYNTYVGVTVEPSVIVCTDEQFTCLDGKCVDARRRCDGTYDCLDGSDELECC